MIILVNSLNNVIDDEKTTVIQSIGIICPDCKKPCQYGIKNYRIQLYHDIKENERVITHNNENIKLCEFINTQKLDLSEIKCEKCTNKNKSNTVNNDFYICKDCKINLCPICKSEHDKDHIIINYDSKYYICDKHNKAFIKYCEDCKMDTCLDCIEPIDQHKNHNLISYENEVVNLKNLKIKLND